jgi:hypothetical protein
MSCAVGRVMAPVNITDASICGHGVQTIIVVEGGREPVSGCVDHIMPRRTGLPCDTFSNRGN